MVVVGAFYDQICIFSRDKGDFLKIQVTLF